MANRTTASSWTLIISPAGVHVVLLCGLRFLQKENPLGWVGLDWVGLGKMAEREG